jgi:type VI secretion system protein
MSEIFISYARSTEHQARLVADALKARGHGVWWDAELPAHRAYAEVIEERLTQAKAVVVIWSAEAAKSQWVRAEADMARESGKLVQLRLDSAAPPLPFNQIQCANLDGWTGDLNAPGWLRVLAGVEALTMPLPKPASGLVWVEPALPDKPSIAVLPFTDLSKGEEADQFADGMTEEITNALARIPSLFVITSSSTVAYRDGARDLKKIARDLGVRYLLEGSVRMGGGRTRIVVKLIDASRGAQIWTERFDETSEDVFALQDKVAISVAGVIDETLGAVEFLRGAPEPKAGASTAAPAPPARAKTPSILTLAIGNIDRMEEGGQTALTLDCEGAVIGRSPHADWTLPDARNYISSTHAEVEYRDGGYWLTDRSTNGVFVNGAPERLSEPHLIAEGDEIVIGQYRLEASLAAKPEALPPLPTLAEMEDVWAKLQINSQVDWSRAEGARREPAPADVGAGERSPAEAAWAALMVAAGLDPEETAATPRMGATAGAMLRQLVAGLVVLLEARARAKAQLGAERTAFNPDGNNPLKFAHTPGQAMLQLLGPAQRGYLPADQAVDDALKDLQAHQMATTAAMPRALRATLERFSPRAIRQRAENQDLLSKLIPGAQEAALWRAYEKEFEGMLMGSDEAFMTVFAQAFRDAYEEAAERGW